MDPFLTVVTQKVTISSTAYALLWHDIIKTKYSQEGFLIGEYYEQESRRIDKTDNSYMFIKPKVVHIHSSIPCFKSGCFDRGDGTLNLEKISSLLGDLATKLVGFYKYEPNRTDLKPSVRETLIHTQLATRVNFSQDMFITCLLTQSMPQQNVIVHKEIFFNKDSSTGTFKPLQMTILNRQKFHSNISLRRPESEAMKKIVETAKLEILREKRKAQGNHFEIEEAQLEAQSKNMKFAEEEVVAKMPDILQEHVHKTKAHFLKAEKELFDLEVEIANQKLELAKRQRKEKALRNRCPKLEECNIKWSSGPKEPTILEGILNSDNSDESDVIGGFRVENNSVNPSPMVAACRNSKDFAEFLETENPIGNKPRKSLDEMLVAPVKLDPDVIERQSADCTGGPSCEKHLKEQMEEEAKNKKEVKDKDAPVADAEDEIEIMDTYEDPQKIIDCEGDEGSHASWY